MPLCRKHPMRHPIALAIIVAATLATIAVSLDMAAAPAAPAAPGQGALTYVVGSTKRVSQLTGDLDRTLGQPTLSRTGKRFGAFATDLGSSFEHRGKLFFLFGDTVGRAGDRDAVTWTRSRDPSTIRLDFFLDKDGK